MLCVCSLADIATKIDDIIPDRQDDIILMRQLSHWLKAYMEYSAHTEAPDKFHFWVGVSTIAGALRRRVWIDQGYFQWVPNFYIILVAPPGIVSKSTTLNVGMELLRKLDGVKFGPDAVTWQSLTQSLAQSAELVLMPDGTYAPMCCITIASGEFGTFLNPNDKEFVNVLTDLWDGKLGIWEKATKTQGSDRIENPWINLAACTTPGWIAGNFPEYLIGGGFTSRCVFVYADQKRKLVAYPSESLPPEFLDLQGKLVHDLEVISLLRGPFHLSDEARAWGTKWYEDHYRTRNAELDNTRFAGYLARKQTHIHKLAMVLSASYKDDLVITQKDLEDSAAIVTALEADMPQVFEFIGLQGKAKYAADVLALIKANSPITDNALYRKCFKLMGLADYKEALGACLVSGHVRAAQENNVIVYHYG